MNKEAVNPGKSKEGCMGALKGGREGRNDAIVL